MSTTIARSIIYLTLNQVLMIHQSQLKAFGGSAGIRNREGLESATEQPKASFGGDDLYPTIFDKASVYAFHIAEAQAFVDGNKRTALHAAVTFLAVNGKPIGHSDRLYEAMIAIAEKRLSRENLSDLFRELYIESLKID
jgi:death-on-curing protein